MSKICLIPKKIRLVFHQKLFKIVILSAKSKKIKNGTRKLNQQIYVKMVCQKSKESNNNALNQNTNYHLIIYIKKEFHGKV